MVSLVQDCFIQYHWSDDTVRRVASACSNICDMTRLPYLLDYLTSLRARHYEFSFEWFLSLPVVCIHPRSSATTLMDGSVDLVNVGLIPKWFAARQLPWLNGIQ